MSRVTQIAQLQSAPSIEELRRFTTMAIAAIIAQVNGRLDFVDNVRASGPLPVSFPIAGVTISVPHSLGRTPVGYIVLTQDVAGNVILPPEGTSNWNPTHIFVQASSNDLNVSLMLI